MVMENNNISVQRKDELDENLLNFCNIGRTRQKISRFLQLPRSTAFDLLKKLEKDGKIYNYSISQKRIGRPKIFWKSIEHSIIVNAELNEISKELFKYSFKIRKAISNNEKVKILVELNEFLNEHGELIKKQCPDMINNIINSL